MRRQPQARHAYWLNWICPPPYRPPIAQNVRGGAEEEEEERDREGLGGREYHGDGDVGETGGESVQHLTPLQPLRTFLLRCRVDPQLTSAVSTPNDQMGETGGKAARVRTSDTVASIRDWAPPRAERRRGSATSHSAGVSAARARR